MNRRTFLAAFSGTFFELNRAAFAKPRGGIVLEAVFGAHLPQTLRIVHWPVMTSLPNWFELRTYNSGSLHERLTNTGIFGRSGIHPLLFEAGTNLTYLIPFDSLAQRNRAWTLIDADPEWHRLRSEGEPVSVAEVTIYRPQQVGQTIGFGRLFRRPAAAGWQPTPHRNRNFSTL
jgi:hypothetical protein